MTTMTTEQIFTSLNEAQKQLVRNCDNSVAYLGVTQVGTHTYFFDQNGWGYVSLPIAPEGDEFPHIDWEHVVIRVGPKKWFDFEGKEFVPPPFRFLVHVDLRKWNIFYKDAVEREGPFTDTHEEESFLVCCGGGSCLPERAAKALGVEEGASVPWAANFRLSPWELTEELLAACVAVTVVYPDDRRVALL